MYIMLILQWVGELTFTDSREYFVQYRVAKSYAILAISKSNLKLISEIFIHEWYWSGWSESEHEEQNH